MRGWTKILHTNNLPQHSDVWFPYHTATVHLGITTDKPHMGGKTPWLQKGERVTVKNKWSRILPTDLDACPTGLLLTPWSMSAEPSRHAIWATLRNGCAVTPRSTARRSTHTAQTAQHCARQPTARRPEDGKGGRRRCNQLPPPPLPHLPFLHGLKSGEGLLQEGWGGGGQGTGGNTYLPRWIHHTAPVILAWVHARRGRRRVHLAECSVVHATHRVARKGRGDETLSELGH